MEKFLFFTDPHLFLGEDYFLIDENLLLLKHYVDKFHISYVICGGDWLRNGDSPTEATKKLEYIHQCANRLFDKYYPVLGNHDTNYQGVDVYGNKNGGRLPKQTLINILFKKYNATYYTFDGQDTHFYVLDCGIDWDYEVLTEDRCKQIHWFAKNLCKEDTKHSAVIMHIYFICRENLHPTAFAKEIGDCLFAYNQRKQFCFEGVRYDFSKCKGQVGFILSGHLHQDVIDYIQGEVPIITTANAFQNGEVRFDILEIDYQMGEMKLSRIGEGEDRKISLSWK